MEFFGLVGYVINMCVMLFALSRMRLFSRLGLNKAFNAALGVFIVTLIMFLINLPKISDWIIAVRLQFA